MYNKFLERYLDYNPEKVISKKGVIVRKIISPVLRFVVPFVTPNSKLTIVRRAKLQKNLSYLQQHMDLERMLSILS